MAYNYRKAEKEWLAWKQKEETQLRALGTDENTIRQLNEFDWKQFKRDRAFYRWQTNIGETDLWTTRDDITGTDDVDRFLDEVENERLLQLLRNTDRQTVKMALMWSSGYTAEEVCAQMGVSAYTYYNRIKYFKKKARKFLSSD